MAITIGQVYESLDPVQEQAAALIFGAIADNNSAVNESTPVAGNKTLGDVYASMTKMQQMVVCFMAGGVEPSDSSVEHLDAEDNSLEHHGVLGMHWGVRRPVNSSGQVYGQSHPSTAPGLRSKKTGEVTTKLSKSTANTRGSRALWRQDVKSSGGTHLEGAHIAALKSKGHRAANFVLGDKTFWKRTGIIAGVAGVGVGTALLAPHLLGAGVLTGIGMHAIAAIGPSAGVHAYTIHGVTGIVASTGGHIAVTKGLAAAMGAATAQAIGLTAAGVGTAGAAAGNVASNAVRAVRGNARINKSYEKLGAATYNHQFTGSKKVAKILSVNGNVKLKHDDDSEAFNANELDDILALAHHGILGMRWGVRRPVNSSGLVVKTGGSSGPGGSGGRAGGSQEKSSADHERATTALNKASTHGRSSLSNEELNALTKRIEVEKKFVQLTSGEKSALQKQVDQMRLESDYRRLRAESSQARKSAGRRLVEALLGSARDAAVKQASSYGEDLVKELLGTKTRDLKGEINSMKLKKEHYDLSQEVRKRGISAPPTVRTHSPVGTPFRVNPSKVRFTKINNLPNLKPTGP